MLDLAAGTGDITEAVAGRVVRVISTDLSAVMVEAARRRGVANAEHRVMDMQQIDLPDSSVDAVVSRFGYMLVPDPARALRETRRVLRDGGRLAFATWAPAKRNPWAMAYGPVLIERGLQEPPKPGEPGQFSLSTEEEIEPLVREAGFSEVTVAEVPVEYRFARLAGVRARGDRARGLAPRTARVAGRGHEGRRRRRGARSDRAVPQRRRLRPPRRGSGDRR